MEQREINLTWIVYRYDVNKGEVVTFDVFRNLRFRGDVIPLINKNGIPRDTFEHELNVAAMRAFWKKYEYEIDVAPAMAKDISKNQKIDIYDQLMLNWDRFANYVWSRRANSIMAKHNIDDSEIERWYSLDDIVVYLNVSRETVIAWIKNKGLPAVKVGHVWRFKISEVDAWMKINKVQVRQRIVKNAIKCNHCGDVIESKYRHDYVECSCGTVAVDGGHAYLRRCFKNTQDDYTDLSIVEYYEVND